MKTLLSRATVVLVVTAFVVATLPHMGNMPPWLSLLVVLAAGWRLLAAWKHFGPPHWLVRAALTFGGLSLVVMHYGTFWGRRAATVLLCTMIAAKLTEMFRLRDARMVASLCFFLIATQFLFSQELLLLGWLLGGCWLAIAALARIQRDADRLAPAEHDSADSEPGALAGPVLRGGALLIALAIPFALVLFLLFPRLGSPLWGMPDSALDGRTGVSDEMTPGSIVSLFIDDSPAFRVEFEGEVPPPSERYWRGPVLWRLDGQTWKRVYYSNREAERVPDMAEAPYRYTVQIEPSERRWLFALDYPARWPADARVSADYELVRDKPVTTLTRYRVASQPDFVDTPHLMELYRRVGTALPADSNPRTVEYARELRRRFPDNDRALINEVLRWFNQEEFFYSLEAPPLGRNMADEFLFDLRTGYCEYYASSFAILMRAAGIPTRIVTGYQGGYWQENGGYLLVRQSDAHAWNEVWLDGQGWMRIDPTAAVAPDRILDGARDAVTASRGWLDQEWLYQLRNRFDQLQFLWNQWVLGFNADRQRRMLDGFGLDDIPSGLYAALMLALAGIVLVPLAWWLQQTARQRRRPSSLERAWRALQRRAYRAGVPRQIDETPLELVSRARGHVANLAELHILAWRYCRAHYGPAVSSTNQGDEHAALARQIRRWRPRRLNSGDGKTVQRIDNSAEVSS